MSRGNTTFKQRDLKAAIKAAEQSGARIARVEVRPDGTIVVIMGEPAPATAPSEIGNDEWYVLKK